MIIHNTAACLAIGAAAVIVLISCMAELKRKSPRRAQVPEVLAEAAEIHRQDEQRRYDAEFDRIVQGELDDWNKVRPTIPVRDIPDEQETP